MITKKKKELELEGNVVCGKSHAGKTRKLIEIANFFIKYQNVIFVNNEEYVQTLREMGLDKRVTVIKHLEKNNLNNLCGNLKNEFPGSLFFIDNINMFVLEPIKYDKVDSILNKYKDFYFSIQKPINC